MLRHLLLCSMATDAIATLARLGCCLHVHDGPSLVDRYLEVTWAVLDISGRYLGHLGWLLLEPTFAWLNSRLGPP